MCKPENQPALSVRVVVVDRPHGLPSVARVQTLMRDGSLHSVAVQEWPGSRPTPEQMEALLLALAAEVSTAIVGTRGVQLAAL